MHDMWSTKALSDTATIEINNAIYAYRVDTIPWTKNTSLDITSKTLRWIYSRDVNSCSNSRANTDSASIVQRRLRQVRSTHIISKYKEGIVLMDVVYWWINFGMLLMLYACLRRLLWRKLLDKKETVADCLKGIEWLCEHGFKIFNHCGP